ncbi:hypothetical protein AB0M43_23115 [Longispora sp. NPDC051575]|uniref:hypothetical protein n=1 Tax=Longispora sp. NPDC051575 TaxID=3154943 RepID=UPI003416A360
MARWLDFDNVFVRAALWVLVAAVGVLYGTVLTVTETGKVRAYARAPVCVGTSDDGCVRESTAPTWGCERRGGGEYAVTHHLRVGERARPELVRVDDAEVCGGKGEELGIRWFRGEIVGVRRGAVRSVTEHTPAPPYLWGMLGLVFWTVVFWNGTRKGQGLLGREWDSFAFGSVSLCAVLGSGYLLVTWLLDGVWGLVRPEPRLILVSVALTPGAAVVTWLRVPLPPWLGGLPRA